MEKVNNAKFIVKVEGNKINTEINTISVYDNRSKEYLTDEYIRERNIGWFLNTDDLKETLNWNLNGDSKKYQFKWLQSGEGVAHIFN